MVIAWVNGKYIERRVSVVRVKRTPGKSAKVQNQVKGKNHGYKSVE